MWMYAVSGSRTFVRSINIKKSLTNDCLMLYFPSFRKINTAGDLDLFAAAYLRCSGFNVHCKDCLLGVAQILYYKIKRLGKMRGRADKSRSVETYASQSQQSEITQCIDRLAIPKQLKVV